MATQDLSNPGVQAIIGAWLGALAPLAGEQGIKVANLIPAAQAMLMQFQNMGKVNYTKEDLESAVRFNDEAIALAQGHINALPDDEG